MEKRNHTADREKGVFIKTYTSKDLSCFQNLEQEFEKGRVLSEIIRYPRPIRIEGSSIYYEFLDIRETLFQYITKGSSIDFGVFKRVGEMLRKMHDNGLVHGDFSPINIVFTRDGNLYFIDASFSRHTGGRVKFSLENIYEDISLFLTHLKISKPIYKPWMFFQKKKLSEMKAAFLSGYDPEGTVYDEQKNRTQEIRFMEYYVRDHTTHAFSVRRWIKTLILRLHIMENKAFLGL